MDKSILKKMIFSGLMLISAVQITQHFVTISDAIYGGLFGIALGIMLLGFFKMIKLKKQYQSDNEIEY